MPNGAAAAGRGIHESDADSRITRIETQVSALTSDVSRLTVTVERIGQLMGGLKPPNFAAWAAGIWAAILAAGGLIGYFTEDQNRRRDQRIAAVEVDQKASTQREIAEAEFRGSRNQQLADARQSVKDLDIALQREMRALDATMEAKLAATEERVKINYETNQRFIQNLESFRLQASNKLAILETLQGRPNGIKNEK